MVEPMHNGAVLTAPSIFPRDSLRIMKNVLAGARVHCTWWYVSVALAACPALALDTSKPLSDLTHQTWSVDEGLPHSTVRSVAQTADGYLWFATHEGAARFDVFGHDLVPLNIQNADRPGGPDSHQRTPCRSRKQFNNR